MLNVIMMSAIYAECHYAKCHNPECHYAEYHNTECPYAKSLGTSKIVSEQNVFFEKNVLANNNQYLHKKK